MKKYLPVLEKCALFEGITGTEISAMLGCLGAKPMQYGKNETIFSEGEQTHKMGIVLSGMVQIVRNDFYGNRSIVASVEPSQLFGETFACADIPRLPVNAVAAEKSEVLLIDCRRITQTCSNACDFHNRMVLNLLKVVAAKNLLLTQKIGIMSKRSTKEKLMAYLMEQAKLNRSSEFTIPFDRQQLADYLGVERSALSAEIGKLRSSGMLEADRSRFRLLQGS